MNLSPFKDTNLFEAVNSLFTQLGIKLNSNTTSPLPIEGILKENLKDTAIFRSIDKTYFAGLINDNVLDESGKLFESKITFKEAEKAINSEEKYDGMMVFAVDLAKNYEPNRFDITEITRSFNRISKNLPVILVIRYFDRHGRLLFSFAACERTAYKQNWRLGEKVGKVSLLKDIDITSPHSAHLRILKNLSTSSIKALNRKPITSFNELYISWQSILNISALNKAFYDEIITWFNAAIHEIKLPSQKAESEPHKDFTIRLIARLIFIWFLKELKVVNDELLVPVQPNGEDNKLIHPKKSGASYYKFVLQNLFFNALNKEQSERKEAIDDFDSFASYLPEADKIKELILSCPFLNGGLFDENENDYVSRKTANNAFVVPDSLLIGKFGLNTLLSGYKFTIAENTPLDEEVAVDPEMLGRIFENLLAEQREDTKEAARRNAGAFYTPRPVVSYMCKNLLLRHLNIDIIPKNGKAIVHKLLETSVIDPACGSGAFPMGMLEEMMSVLDIADPDGEIWFGEMLDDPDANFRKHIKPFIQDKQTRYVKKLGLLRNCLFGIDLLDYAVEITKLRCWLSLIVEQKVDFSKENYNLKPLPNLEFKFYNRNSLLRTFMGQNINEMIDKLDKKNLLDELMQMENNYFITKSDKYGTKDEIKKKIYGILEGVVDSQIKQKNIEFNSARSGINHLKSSNGSKTQLATLEKKAKKLSEELAELASFKDKIKDYFIERVVFPGLFNKNNPNPGFDMVIGNPPYVNTKLINQMGLTETLKEEYGFCDDLYNHFTFRGMELLKQGGFLSYITSDTFLTIQSKENMRRLFLGLESNKPTTTHKSQSSLFEEITLTTHIPTSPKDLFGKSKAIQTELISVKTATTQEEIITEQKHFSVDCRLLEIINTPKAFAAMVDTAIFTIQKEAPKKNDTVTYIDIRFPSAETFGITEAEWQSIKENKNSIAGWEKILNKVMLEIQIPVDSVSEHQPQWVISHTCDNTDILSDSSTKIQKYKLLFDIYRKTINYRIFPPNKVNCIYFDRIVKQIFSTYNSWWSKIETSKKIDKYKSEINAYINSLKVGDITLLGLLSDGGVGLQTGDNGTFLGAIEGTNSASRIVETRPIKLKEVLDENPDIRKHFKILKDCFEIEDYSKTLSNLSELEIHDLFDSIKEKYGKGIFPKGYIYKIITEKRISDVAELTPREKINGISDSKKQTWVIYYKGDKDGNKWLAETEFCVEWNKSNVEFLRSSNEARFQSEQFYFLDGFSWNLINGSRNVNDFKVKFIPNCVNDVGGMKLSVYEEFQSKISAKYIVCIFNSKTINKLTESFINFTLNFQINDARQIPIKIPTKTQLEHFNQKFDSCYNIKLRQFSGELNESHANALLKPIEKEIDRMVEELYGIE